MATPHRLCLSLPFCALGVSAVLSAQAPQLLSTVSEVPAAVRAWHAADKAENATLADVRFVRVATRLLEAKKRVRVELFGKSVELELLGDRASLRHRILDAKLIGQHGDATFVLAPDGVVSASLHVGDETYALNYSGRGDFHRLARIDLGKQKHACACGKEHEVDPGPQREMLPNNTTRNVDVAVFYTPRARSTAGGKRAMEAQIVLRIANATRANVTCKVPWAFRLVYMAETNYAENGGTIDLSRFRSTSAPMAEVHAARSKWGADLMALITQPGRAQYCGVAYLMTRLSTGFRSAAFGVTLRQCLAGNTLSHEMGHNCGSHHDRANAGRALFSYSYGARTTGNRYRSIMSYRPGTRVNQWSSSSVKYNGQALGDANNDNSRSLTNAGNTIANFYPTRTLEWCELSGGVRGRYGVPRISGAGTVNDARTISMNASSVADNTVGVAVFGGRTINAKIFGGTLVPSLDVAVVVKASGSTASVGAGFLSLLPRNTSVWGQMWFYDTRAPQSFSATNGIKTIRP